MKHPKVLHLGFQPIGAPTNSGLTLASMFGDWPDQQLMQLCLKGEPLAPALGTVLIAPPSIAPLDGLVRSVLGRHVPSGAVDGLNNSVSRRDRSMSLNTRLRVAATTINDIGPVRLPAACTRAIADYQPEVIHTLLGGVRAMRVALSVSRKFNLPIVPHFMDDWPMHLFADGRLFGLPRSCVERDLDAVLERSPVLLTIGEEMRSEFEGRYDKPAVVVGNSVDIERFDAASVTHPPAEGVRVMRYVGGLHLGRDALVHRVAQALMVRANEHNPWILEMFVSKSDAADAERLAKTYSVVKHQGSVTPDEVPEVLTSAHAQVFLESSDPDIASFTRLSVSTKVPQYLAARRPVLVLGDADQGSVQTLLRSGLGVYAGPTADSESLSTALDTLDRLVDRPPSGVLDPASFDVRVVRARLAQWMARGVAEWHRA